MKGDDLIPPEVLASMLLRLFAFSPIAICISTAGTEGSRYVKVNDAYLRLIGRSWEDIHGEKLVDAGAVHDAGRERRARLLDEVGSFLSEEVEVRHASGRLIPTLVSAQRTIANGTAFDIEIILDISTRVRIQRELERHLTAAALTDALTGLPNRAHFDEVLERTMAMRREGDGTVALAFLDLNGFKTVNDVAGHATGDHVLRLIADRLRATCRPGDFAARIGGDEFAVLLANEEGTVEGLRQRLAACAAGVFAPVTIGDSEFRVGAAVGVAVSSPSDDGPALLRAADRQMYLAKATGEPVCLRIGRTEDAAAG